MSIDASQVALVIPTRGDVPLADCARPWLAAGVTRIHVWDNMNEEDMGVYGRYAVIERAHGPVIATQDDDCVLPPASIQALLDSYEPGVLVANLPAKFHERYKDRETTLVGFGAIFDRDLPDIAFTRFGLSSHRNGCIAWGAEGFDIGLFNRTCDLVFAGLTPHKTLDLPYEDLPWARDESRMWRQPGHFEERLEMMSLVRAVRDGVIA